MTTPADNGRRVQPERRNPSARRRHAEARSVHIELCHSDLRVALITDEAGSAGLLTTHSLHWRKEAPELCCDEGLAELTDALRQLVAEHRLAGSRVSFAISGALCVNRAASGATSRVEEEIASFEERSQLYLTLGPGPKITAVGRKQIDARHEHALVTVSNEQTVATLVQAAEDAGLVVDAVESSLVSLSRLHGRLYPHDDSPVILAQIDGDRYEIGVSRHGELLMEYRPALEATPDSLGATIDKHHDRLLRFCHRQYGLGKWNLDRMWLIGAPDAIEKANTQTELKLISSTMPLEGVARHWRVADERALTSESAAAVGLALRGKDDIGATPNLMEEIHALAKTPIGPFAARAFAPIAATLLIAACLWAHNLQQSMAIAGLQEQASRLAPMALRGEALGQQLIDSDEESTQFSRLAGQVRPTNLAPVLDHLAHCLPDDVWLKQLWIEENQAASLTGASYTEGGVYDFVQHLEQAPAFQKVALKGTELEQTQQGPAMCFDLKFKLSPLAPKEAKP